MSYKNNYGVSYHNNSTATTVREDFIISEYLQYLEPYPKEKGKYICPICGGHNLSIAKNGLKFQCWNGCESKEITKALTKLTGQSFSSQSYSQTGLTSLAAIKKPSKSHNFLPAQSKIAIFPTQPDLILPVPKNPPKDNPKGVPSNATRTYYSYGRCSSSVSPENALDDGNRLQELGWVIRYDWTDESKPKGRDKTFRQWREEDDRLVFGKGDDRWLPYRLDEVLQYGLKKSVVLVEGEKCVEALRRKGTVATTFQGSNWNDKNLSHDLQLLKSIGVKELIFFVDRDTAGQKKSQILAKISEKIGLPVILVPTEKLWQDCPDKGDIFDYLEAYPTMNKDDLIEQIESAISEQKELLDRLDETAKEYGIQPTSSKATPQQMANLLSQELKDEWLYCLGTKSWYRWTGKHWLNEEEHNLKMVVRDRAESEGIEYKNSRWIDDTVKLLALNKNLVDKTNKHWNPQGFINFSNGILDLRAMKLLPHSPHRRFTSLLPRDHYDLQPCLLSANFNCMDAIKQLLIDLLKTHCPEFFKWAMMPMNDNEKAVLKLIAVMRAILTYQFSKEQIFLSLVGQPATGKGTFLRLLKELTGSSSCTSFGLSQLSDGNEIVKIIDKQLAYCGDARELPKGRALEYLLQLTGGDEASYRGNYKDSISGTFLGTLAIASNTPIFVGNTTGIDRRMCLIEFANPIPAHQRNKGLDDLLKNELSQLTAISLAMPDRLMTNLLKGLDGDDISAFKAKQWEMKCQVNSIASWLNERLIYEIGASEPIGTGKNNNIFLYPNYLEYCEESGMKPKTLNNFSKDLENECEEIGWTVERKKGNTGIKMLNVRLRNENDKDIPTYGETLKIEKNISASEPPRPLLTETEIDPNRLDRSKNSDDLAVTGDDLSDDLKPLLEKESDDRDDLNQNFVKENSFFFSSTIEIESIEDIAVGDRVISEGKECWVKEKLNPYQIKVEDVNGFLSTTHPCFCRKFNSTDTRRNLC